MLRILHEGEISNQTECYGKLFALRKPKAYPQPLSVPLSPASDPGEPFEPNSDILVIDLTSEPRSPVDPAVEKLLQGLHDGTLDSEPAAPSSMPSSPPAPRGVFLGDTEDKVSHYKLDVPLMTSSPRGGQALQHHDDVFTLQGIDIEDTVQPLEEPQGFFDEEMSAILASHQAQTTQMLENDRPNPEESLLRMTVPALDFHIPDPDWGTQLSSPENHFEWLRENLVSQQGGQTLRRKAAEESTGLLFGSSDPSATSRLLSSFMELRHAKKSKTTHSTAQQAARQPTQQSTQLPLPDPSPSQLPANESTVEEQLQQSGNHGMRNAPVPEFNVPTDVCRFIVSSSLSRNVLSQLEKSWPQLELVDRDFSQYNTVVWSPGSAQRKEAISKLSFEADISLCPAAGIIVTTMLKVRQRPLPGSTALSPLRERVQNVSAKYEYLFILVSESNPEGEYVGSPSTSDMTAYADFVCFTASLQRDITTYLVSGAESTLSKWVLSLMCHYSLQAKQLGKALDFHDTTWELFLRRAGQGLTTGTSGSRPLANVNSARNNARQGW
ncbi:hypothetical protein CEP54_001033 [Fusarium duplospermum]|uniref:DUF7102 domain-containing protein n=1 Tax=Fusarium duplospermum TaxID=1325734 RepID=A0A428R2T5_9HYPO|nr:hypothetical protein CEP54_001033 [Fusarium duplospermum]